jgi:regulator of sirC expression with transglutaminase-like and TPR domain
MKISMSEETEKYEEILKLYGLLKEMNQLVVNSYEAISASRETVKKVEEFLDEFYKDRIFDKR